MAEKLGILFTDIALNMTLRDNSGKMDLMGNGPSSPKNMDGGMGFDFHLELFWPSWNTDTPWAARGF